MLINKNFWRGRRVFLTGHTGFKGAWLSLLLTRLGAEIHGFALPPEHPNGIFQVADVAADVHHQLGDVRDLVAIQSAIIDAHPEILIHMAAQPLVRYAYSNPIETFTTNVMGTVNVLEAVRHAKGVNAVLVVSSDKCYEKLPSRGGYSETDQLGGSDPYSSSKACVELVTAAYRRSFLSPGRHCHVASARAGNVIGGGDWSADRLVPDAIRAFLAGTALRIRNPSSVRPWQHVLNPLEGYLLLIERLAVDGEGFAEAWNFGPPAAREVPVSQIADELVSLWGREARWTTDGSQHPEELVLLSLDSAKAQARLG